MSTSIQTPAFKREALTPKETNPFIEIISQGKVRNIFDFTGFIFETSNRLSVFDRVIKEEVKLKGNMLNCISQENKKLLEQEGFVTDYIPENRNLFSALGLKDAGRFSYSKRLNMIPFEFIVRGYLTGSAWKAYKNGESYCGFTFPEGMHDGQKLDTPIVTPTTKESNGHDKPVTEQEAIKKFACWLIDEEYSLDSCSLIAEYASVEEARSEMNLSKEAIEFAEDYAEDNWDQLEAALAYELSQEYIELIYNISLLVFDSLSKKYEEKGILFIDTKFEFGFDENGELTLGDEVGTPDSSRYSPKEDYERTGKIVSLDKQIVRDYCSSVGFTGNADEEIPAVPDEIWEKVTNTYVYIAKTIFGDEIVFAYLLYKSRGRIYSDLFSISH